MRLINGDATVDAVDKRIRQIGYENDPLVLSIRQAVREVKPVDAVPVVRCKDCLHNRACEIQYHAQAGDLFFCGAAERKDGDHDS